MNIHNIENQDVIMQPHSTAAPISAFVKEEIKLLNEGGRQEMI
jgi:hypothetical protein